MSMDNAGVRFVGIVQVLTLLALAGCGGGHHEHKRATPTTAAKPATPARRSGPPPRIAGVRPCPKASRLACGALEVPLDHSGKAEGGLRLRVATTLRAKAPHGVLLFLTGGPGQPGVPFMRRVASRLRHELRGYQLVMFDQRGTGEDALRCPRLQREMGTSDLTPPTTQAVTDCARRLGPDRRFYATADTVEDIEDLRLALHADKLTLDGVSYGTFVAERYAIAHPDHVAKLVLDSVVPHAGYDPLDPVPLQAAGRVMDLVCSTCRADLAAVARRFHAGVALLDILTAYSVGAPSYPGIAKTLRDARRGRPARLRRLLASERRAYGAPAAVLSQGLHEATACADSRFPWGPPTAPVATRAAAVARAAAKVTDFGPFDRGTLTGTGTLLACMHWPPTPTAPVTVPRELPPVPMLLLEGERDLSTPLAWARREAAAAPKGRLVVVPSSGHSVQLRAGHNAGRRAATRFLQAPG
jgi:pimeloyl-ACP methyl ester carboxylesterase